MKLSDEIESTIQVCKARFETRTDFREQLPALVENIVESCRPIGITQRRRLHHNKASTVNTNPIIDAFGRYR